MICAGGINHYLRCDEMGWALAPLCPAPEFNCFDCVEEDKGWVCTADDGPCEEAIQKAEDPIPEDFLEDL